MSTSKKTKRVRYAGAPGGVNRDVGAAIGTGGELEPGKTYTVPAELAESLVECSSAWEPIGWKPSEEGEA